MVPLFTETLYTTKRDMVWWQYWVHGIENACCIDSAVRRLSVTKGFAGER